MWPSGAFSRLSPRQLEIDAPGAPYGERRHSAGGSFFVRLRPSHTHGYPACLPCLGRGRRGAPFLFTPSPPPHTRVPGQTSLPRQRPRLKDATAAYRAIRFEREAYGHQDELDYLVYRRPFAWTRERRL